MVGAAAAAAAVVVVCLKECALVDFVFFPVTDLWHLRAQGWLTAAGTSVFSSNHLGWWAQHFSICSSKYRLGAWLMCVRSWRSGHYIALCT